MSTTAWHVPDEDLRRYADREVSPPLLWSLEAHLAACALCRERLAAAADPGLVQTGWLRLDAELDAPRPGRLEVVMVRLGVREHTARLLAATPVLRRSWLAAVALTLALAAVGGHLALAVAAPVVFLAGAPLLPLIGVAVSFGPAADPTYELVLVAPLHTFRLLLLRCAAVLTTTTVLSAGASLLLPGYGLVVLGWLLPALALTLLSLALTPRLGPVTAAVVVGLGWVVLMACTARFRTGESLLFTPAAQLATAIAAAVAATAVLKLRQDFDIGRNLNYARRLP